jgi:hypothetical protein
MDHTKQGFQRFVARTQEAHGSPVGGLVNGRDEVTASVWRRRANGTTDVTVHRAIGNWGRGGSIFWDCPRILRLAAASQSKVQ